MQWYHLHTHANNNIDGVVHICSFMYVYYYAYLRVHDVYYYVPTYQEFNYIICKL